MVHEQLMTQKITPKNRPEQGVDLSGKEGTEKALLPLPISQAQLQELRAWSQAAPRTPSPPQFQELLPATSHRVELNWGNGLSTPHFLHTMHVYPTKKTKTTLRNDICIKCSLNCSVQPCSTTETFSLPVRWVVLHENWLFPANSINTCHCFLMRQYPAIQRTSAGKPALLSLPFVMMLYPCLTTLVQTLGEAESPFRTCCGVWGGARDCVAETCRAAQLCKPQIPQSTVPVQCLAEGTVHSHPQSNAVLK